MSTAKKILMVLMVALAFAGVCITMNPLVQRASTQMKVDKTNAKFEERVEKTEEEEPEVVPYEQLLEHIQYYNKCLYDSKQIALTTKFAYETPAFTLSQYGVRDEVFGIISIPTMEVELPIYLGASEENMANGAAVLGQTSVPIGGINTNSVIAGHRGWNGYPYFLDIELLQIGDLVYVKNLWETLKYEVTEIKTVSPDNVEAILIQEGKDMITLLTCHPPNTGGRERYLVFCERVE